MLGLEVQELTEQQQQEMNLERGGLIVKRVHEGPGKSSGIREGDVIQMINNEKVTTVEQLKEVVGKLPKDKFASVLVQRDEGPEFLAIRIPS